MARFPQDGAAAVSSNVVVQGLRALNLAQNGGARSVGENASSESDQELVAPDDFAGLINGSEAIGVAVVRKAYVCAGLPHSLGQGFKVLGQGGVRMMVGKVPVHVAVQRI